MLSCLGEIFRHSNNRAAKVFRKMPPRTHLEIMPYWLSGYLCSVNKSIGLVENGEGLVLWNPAVVSPSTRLQGAYSNLLLWLLLPPAHGQSFSAHQLLLSNQKEP